MQVERFYGGFWQVDLKDCWHVFFFPLPPVLHPNAWNMNVLAGTPTDTLDNKDKGFRDGGVENLDS